jgi:uncharacterized surface protein with fasciclin (FAS1) repeats
MSIQSLILAALAGVAHANIEAQAPSLPALLSSIKELSNFTQVLDYVPEFLEKVSALKNITFLAPNNTAFAALENTTRGEFLENASKDYLLNLLYYHVLNGTYDNITDYSIVPTLLTSSAYTNVSGGQVVGAYYDDDEDVIGFYSGFDMHPEGARKPIPFNGGVLYVINDILNLPAPMSETVIGDFNGTSFVAGLNSTGLTKEVDSIPDSTYFIPINDGVEAVQEALSSLSPEQLSDVLKYHVVPGTIGYYDTLKNGTVLTTLQGKNLTVFITDAGDMFIDNTGIVYVDLIVANGVVHLIDNVLNPNATIVAPINGTEDGVPEFQNTTPTTSTAVDQGTEATSSVSTVSSTGMAAPLMTGALSVALLGGVAAALNF